MRRPSASARSAPGARSALDPSASAVHSYGCPFGSPGITEASQPQLPASGPSAQPIESSQLGSFYAFQNTSGSSGSYSLQITDVATLGMLSPIGTFTVTDVGSTSSETVPGNGNGILGSVGSNTVSSVIF